MIKTSIIPPGHQNKSRPKTWTSTWEEPQQITLQMVWSHTVHHPRQTVKMAGHSYLHGTLAYYIDHRYTIIVLVHKFEQEILEGHVTSVTVIIKMWFGRDIKWCMCDVPADLLSMGRKTSSFIDNCKNIRNAFRIILSLKCSWKILLNI